MVIKSGFYDSFKGDRIYTSKDFNDVFKGIVDNGVFPNIGNIFQILPASNSGGQKRITVGTGKAWINNHWVEIESPSTILIQNSIDSNSYRADTVYLYVNDRAREAYLDIYTGAEASTEQGVFPYQFSDLNHINLGWILIRPNQTSIILSDIHSWIGTDICPFVNYLATEGQISEAMERFNDRLDLISDKFDSAIFKEGDTGYIVYHGAGYLTAENQSIFFTVPLPKYFPSDSGLILSFYRPGMDSGHANVTIRQNGNYLLGGPSGPTPVQAENFDKTVYGSYMTLRMHGDQSYGGTNNDTVGIYYKQQYWIEQI